jgi:hypothetical protein
VSFPTGYQSQSPFSVENLKEAAYAAQALRIVVPVSCFRSVRLRTGFAPFHVPLCFHGEKSACVRVWIPAAQSDAYQEVRVVSAKADLPLKKKREAKYGNQVYFAEVSTRQQAELHFEIEYDVLRRERLGLRNAAHVVPASLSTEERQKDLQPDVLVHRPINSLYYASCGVAS